MRLYICYGTFGTPRPGGHPCRNAHVALRRAGHSPKLVRSYGLGILPRLFNLTKGRMEVQDLTGNRFVPTLVLDDGTVIDGSEQIVAWAQAHPVS
ncbi:MAG: glutathione S-transferase N-terminal domain-containing protein [Solirubrobacteraceae bacterium]